MQNYCHNLGYCCRSLANSKHAEGIELGYCCLHGHVYIPDIDISPMRTPSILNVVSYFSSLEGLRVNTPLLVIYLYIGRLRDEEPECCVECLCLQNLASRGSLPSSFSAYS